MNFDLSYWKNEYFDFSQTFCTKRLDLYLFTHKVLFWDYSGNSMDKQ